MSLKLVDDSRVLLPLFKLLPKVVAVRRARHNVGFELLVEFKELFAVLDHFVVVLCHFKQQLRGDAVSRRKFAQFVLG